MLRKPGGDEKKCHGELVATCRDGSCCVVRLQHIIGVAARGHGRTAAAGSDEGEVFAPQGGDLDWLTEPRTCKGKSSQGKSSQVKASQGKSRQVTASQGKSRQVKASQGKSRQVKASQGKSRQVKAGRRARLADRAAYLQRQVGALCPLRPSLPASRSPRRMGRRCAWRGP